MTPGTKVAYFQLRTGDGLFSYAFYMLGFVNKRTAMLEAAGFGATVGVTIPSDKWRFIVESNGLSDEQLIQVGRNFSNEYILDKHLTAEPRCFSKQEADRIILEEIEQSLKKGS